MITFYFVAVILIMTYLIYTIYRFKTIPISISNTYYMWKKLNMEWLFTFTMWLTAISIVAYWVSASTCYNCQFLAFTSIAGMVFVGGAAMFKEELTETVHYVSAGLWAASALIFFLVNKMYYPVIIGALMGLFGFVCNKFKNYTFWAEMACVFMMIIGIFLL